MKSNNTVLQGRALLNVSVNPKTIVWDITKMSNGQQYGLPFLRIKQNGCLRLCPQISQQTLEMPRLNCKSK